MPNMTDFRALCAALADSLDAETGCTTRAGVRITHDEVIRARAALAAEPEGATDNELAVNLQIDTTPECLKRLCDGLAAAVRPDGGYKAATLDDPAPGTGCDQMVLVEWWVPQHGCDSLENTLDAIRFRLMGAVRDWWATALAPQPVPKGPSDEELIQLACNEEIGRIDLNGNIITRFYYPKDIGTNVITFARAVLARWGQP
jgi:hypothetical protein